ncbi:MAG: ATP-binding protein [Lachnospiraceae bacterium]|nr:ATP-binding protein [Lachnospiraceae bacterium]
MALTDQQYHDIMRQYEQIRYQNAKESERRREEVYRKIPGYEELERSISTAALKNLHSLLEGDTTAIDSMHDEVREHLKRKQALLTEAGFPADYLEPIYQCAACKDTGYLNDTVYPKQKCSCMHQKEIALLYAQSQIQELIAKENFSTLSYAYYKGEDLDRFRGAVKISEDFVQNFEHDYHNLFFYGTVGTGKSFLSGCIANELLQQGHFVLYFSSIRLFEQLANYTFANNERQPLSDLQNDIHNCDLLIIDDLGTEMTNSFTSTQLFNCLNERHLRHKATIISTNLSLEELQDRYSDRVFSRITGNYILCKLSGQDIRMCKKLSN